MGKRGASVIILWCLIELLSSKTSRPCSEQVCAWRRPPRRSPRLNRCLAAASPSTQWTHFSGRSPSNSGSISSCPMTRSRQARSKPSVRWQTPWLLAASCRAASSRALAASANDGPDRSHVSRSPYQSCVLALVRFKGKAETDRPR